MSAKVVPSRDSASETCQGQPESEPKGVDAAVHEVFVCAYACVRVTRTLPREDDVVLLHDEAHKRSHRDAPVLDLRLPQEADRGLLALAPEVVAVTQPQRVEVPDVGVALAGENLEAVLQRRTKTSELKQAAVDAQGTLS